MLSLLSVVALFSCLQDADLLLKMTEEVNGTLKNKVSFHLFFLNGFCYTFSAEPLTI